MSHLVKNVSKSQKVGKAVSITYTVANWIKKGISIHNGLESTKSIKPTLRTIAP
ncbi:hypothetical protein [uncultured Clostridium sp.]|uniref:hypothetical protein n=1 Tax=uncultured Clostridium sp. TaxID=59620 RepID=UPI0026153A94|nr:hypothetical protein [uncultured Clostridium sp.]